MRTYGFIQSPPDERDIIFDASAVVPEEYRLRNVPAVMDQGERPICAAISLSYMINWQERAKTGKDAVKPNSVYELRGNKDMQGMIPRVALNNLKKQGADGYKIKGYSRVLNPDSAKAAIQVNGPIMACFSTYDKERFWEPGGQEMGGHAVILTGWQKDGFILQNSWGTQWGNNGIMILPNEDWQYVIESWTIML